MLLSDCCNFPQVSVYHVVFLLTNVLCWLWFEHCDDLLRWILLSYCGHFPLQSVLFVFLSLLAQIFPLTLRLNFNDLVRSMLLSGCDHLPKASFLLVFLSLLSILLWWISLEQFNGMFSSMLLNGCGHFSLMSVACLFLTPFFNSLMLNLTWTNHWLVQVIVATWFRWFFCSRGLMSCSGQYY